MHNSGPQPPGCGPVPGSGSFRQLYGMSSDCRVLFRKTIPSEAQNWRKDNSLGQPPLTAID